MPLHYIKITCCSSSSGNRIASQHKTERTVRATATATGNRFRFMSRAQVRHFRKENDSLSFPLSQWDRWEISFGNGTKNGVNGAEGESCIEFDSFKKRLSFNLAIHKLFCGGRWRWTRCNASRFLYKKKNQLRKKHWNQIASSPIIIDQRLIGKCRQRRRHSLAQSTKCGLIWSNALANDE